MDASTVVPLVVGGVGLVAGISAAVAVPRSNTRLALKVIAEINKPTPEAEALQRRVAELERWRATHRCESPTPPSAP